MFVSTCCHSLHECISSVLLKYQQTLILVFQMGKKSHHNIKTLARVEYTHGLFNWLIGLYLPFEVEFCQPSSSSLCCTNNNWKETWLTVLKRKFLTLAQDDNHSVLLIKTTNVSVHLRSFKMDYRVGLKQTIFHFDHWENIYTLYINPNKIAVQFLHFRLQLEDCVCLFWSFWRLVFGSHPSSHSWLLSDIISWWRNLFPIENGQIMH